MPIPKVKTGPTRGQERSRKKKSKEWRKQRSDAGKPRPKNKR